MTKGKTFVENSVIFDKGLSLEAIGLYAILKHYSTIPNFEIKREHIKSISGYGETAFRRVWKELKSADLLIETKYRVKGEFKFKFSLVNNIKKAVDLENKPSVDSNGDLPLDGQIHYTEVESENTGESDNVKMVLDKYPNIKLSQKQKEVINSTEKDTLEFALDGIFVDEINGTYLLGAIERAKASENKVIVFPSDEAEKRRTKYIPFVDDCSSRPNIEEYYNSIEDRLLGWK